MVGRVGATSGGSFPWRSLLGICACGTLRWSAVAQEPLPEQILPLPAPLTEEAPLAPDVPPPSLPRVDVNTTLWSNEPTKRTAEDEPVETTEDNVRPLSESALRNYGGRFPDGPPEYRGINVGEALGLDRGAGSLDVTASIRERVGLGSSFNEEAAVFHVGRFRLRGSISAGVVAESESGLGGAEKPGWEAGTQFGLSLSGAVGGDGGRGFLGVDYAASWQVGGRPSSSGTMDQILSVNGHYGFAKLDLSVRAAYSHLTGPDRDFGESTDRDVTSVDLTAAYPLSEKTNLELTLSGADSAFGGGIDSEELSGTLFLNRKISAKTQIALGATVGILEVTDSERQTFQQVNFRVQYALSSKVAFSSTVGYEFRAIGGRSSATPVFSGGVSYAITPRMHFNLEASRAVTNSATERQTNYVSTTVSGMLSQQVGAKLSVGISVGVQNAEYDSTTNNGTLARTDNLLFFRPNLQLRLTRNFSVSLYYSYAKNDSNIRSFVTQQAGLSGVYTF